MLEECLGRGQVWEDCGSNCTSTCDEPSPACSESCVPRCQCPSDQPMWENGECIREEACQRRLQNDEDELTEELVHEQHVEACADNGQIWKECGSNCTRTCAEPDPVCSESCVPRCQCPSDQPMWDNGECIREEACQRRVQDEDEDLAEELRHEQ